MRDDFAITTAEQLSAIYGDANPNSLVKETDHLNEAYRAWIERSPFFALASIGGDTDGIDCSPRGDAVGQVFRILDDRTLLIPDRRGNNRIDTLLNIVRDPRVALLFLTPGINETLRINGRAYLNNDPAVCESFAVDGKLPRCVIRVEVDSVYFQCARALKRAGLWDPTTFAKKGDVPTAGQMSKSASPSFDGDAYDAELDQRQAETMY